MSFSIACAALVKTPTQSNIKTRLARDIGKEHAETFYLLSVKAMEALMHNANNNIDNLTPIWVVNEPQSLNHPLWQTYERRFSGEGGLGEKLHHTYATLQQHYDIVVIIGSDSPQLPLSIITQTVEYLRSYPSNFVIGPSEDGGYYLFAGRTPISQHVWLDTPYSAHNTRAEFLKRLAPSYVHELPIYGDVDYVSDMQTCYEQITDDSLKEQQNVKQWMINQGYCR